MSGNPSPFPPNTHQTGANSSSPSVTILIPTKDEKGNIEPMVRRMPDFGTTLELLFVDGHSKDGTLEEVARVAALYPGIKINCFIQEGKGKREAVWQGFERSQGDIVLILDGDITVPPEEIVEAYRILAGAPAIFLNATRFTFPMEKGAMQWPNYLANRFFALLVSLIIGKRLSDSLCGTKGMWKKEFLRLNDDPFLSGIDLFGDHELIFGAWRLGMEFVEHPVHYKARLYGEAKIANQKFSGGSAFLRIDLAALSHKLFAGKRSRH
jgi:glycosyltransferase involved in cell wall biosynthesis